MTYSNISRKTKSLEYNIEHLKLELEELNEELCAYTADFSKNFYSTIEFAEHVQPTEQNLHQAQDQHNTEVNPTSSDFHEIQIEDQQVQPAELKKIWKKIAFVTHPDKTGNHHKYTRLYKKAAEAWKQLDTRTLMQIAVELRLEMPEISNETSIDILRDTQKTLQKELSKIESSVLIQWGRVKSQEEKDILMNFYIGTKGYTKKQNA